MNIKSLLLGSAAALAAVSGAQAADAIVAAEPEPMEYVRVCDAFGTGYFYIPGTETCLKIGGYVRFQVDFGDDSFPAGARDPEGSDWDAWTRGRIAVTSKSDTELGELTGFIALHVDTSENTSSSNADDDAYLDEVYLQLGGFKAGTYLNWWDKGINGETDSNAGGAQVRYTSIAYTYTGEAFAAGIQLDELSYGSGVGPVDGGQEVGIEGLITAKFGGVAVDLLGSYDFGAEEGAVRLLASAEVGPGILQGFVIWASDPSAYYGGNINAGGSATDLAGEWSVAASYAFKATDRFTVTPGIQYVFDEFNDGDDDWRAGVTLDYAITTGLSSKVSVQYQDEPDTVSGFVRLQRDF